MSAESVDLTDDDSIAALEDGKAKLFADKRERNPARRIGTAEDVADAAMLALTNTFMPGLTLHVDGGERLT